MKKTIIPTFWTVVEICHEILTDSENGIQEKTSFLSSPSRPFSKRILHTHLLTSTENKKIEKISANELNILC